VLGEIFAPGPREVDETVAAFAARRLGREGFEKLIDPMVSGVFAGDSEALSLKSCFPRIHDVEREHGSLIRGLVTLQWRARHAGRKDLPGPGPGGRLTSFAGGMAALTDALAARLGARLQLGTPVAAIARAGGRFELQLGDGSGAEAERLILAVPAYVQAHLLGGLDRAFAPLLEDIDYPPIAVVCLGYGGLPENRRPDGFGFLVPSRERRSILGAVIDSNVFAGRAPSGSTLVRCMAGGARNPRVAELPDEKLLQHVTGDLREIAGIDVPPDLVRIFRHEKAIPQYRVGHAARLGVLDGLLAHHPGLWLTGNALRGVSLNDCVVNAFRIAREAVP
jgi:oxygen-dependent protoporphyrinogen oxidase